jgi:hypothetical protein
MGKAELLTIYFVKLLHVQPFMKISSFYICLSVVTLYLSCQKKTDMVNITNHISTRNVASPYPNQKFSILDSLKKFGGGKDTLLIDEASDATLFIGRTNNKNFGVYIVSDKSLQFYQETQLKWVKSPIINYNLMFSFATCEDINGDNINDIIISCLSGSAGNTEDTVFIYDKKTEMFKHNESFDLTNVAYDKKGKFVRSSWYTSAVHCQTKMKYFIKGDSLAFGFGVSFCPDDIDGSTGTLTHFKMRDNKRVAIDSLTGKSGKLWRKFEKEFWNSKHDMID